MNKTKQAIAKLQEAGAKIESGLKPYLELAKKDERSIPRSTGVHLVKLTDEEAVNNIRIYTSKEKFIEVQGIRYWFETENGESKCYDVPFFKKSFYLTRKEENKIVNYLLLKFENVEIGEKIEMEYVQKGVDDGYIDVRKVGQEQGNGGIDSTDDIKFEVATEY